MTRQEKPDYPIDDYHQAVDDRLLLVADIECAEEAHDREGVEQCRQRLREFDKQMGFVGRFDR